MVDFGNADLTDAHFGRLDGYADVADVTDLRGADLSQVEGLESVDWGEGVVHGSLGDNATQWPPGFHPPASLPQPDPDNVNQGPRCRPFQYRLTD
jgi:hypothetical protein